jgi:hypothetical protein
MKHEELGAAPRSGALDRAAQQHCEEMCCEYYTNPL